MIDLRYVDDVELNMLTKLKNIIKLNDFNEEELTKFTNLTNEANNILEKRIKERKELQEREDDLKKQIETKNFKYICGACGNGIIPRCLNLYDEKYCTAIFSTCEKTLNNPNYQKKIKYGK